MHRVGLQKRPLLALRLQKVRRNGAVRPSSALASNDGDILNDTRASDEPSSEVSPAQRGSFFVESVLPVRDTEWDFRIWPHKRQQAITSARIKEQFSVTHKHGFHVLSVESTPKDGGVFVKFGYNPEPGVSPPKALEEVEAALKKEIGDRGGISTWYGLGKATFYPVKGKPWNEDLSVFPTNILKIEFEGPDVHQELLYEVLRPYGRITSMTKPAPVPTGSLRSVTVTFSRTRSAILARNCLHGIGLSDNTLSNAGTATSPTKTRLVFTYEKLIKPHVVRDWLSSHPRIVLPVVAFLLGTLTYTVFDPIRSFFVKSKVIGSFDYHEWRIVKFIRKNVYDKVKFSVRTSSFSALDDVAGHGDSESTVSDPTPTTEKHGSSFAVSAGGEWKERQEAERYLFSYLAEMPSTIAVLHGPQGSGKSKMLKQILSRSGAISGADEAPRKTIEIDCEEIHKASSDSGLVASLAKQTGYWPVFSFLSSVNHMIDLASVGLIGQKAGFSTTVESQMKEILEVTGGALKQVRADLAKKKSRKAAKEKKTPEPTVQMEKPENDNQATPSSETSPSKGESKASSSLLGVAVSTSAAAVSASVNAVSSSVAGAKDEFQGLLTKTGILGDRIDAAMEDEWKRSPSLPVGPPRVVDESINSMPVVVIRNFSVKNAGKREELLDIIADWAATLIDNKVAHVIVLSDNRENMRRLAKALPTRPLLSIPLGDADAASAMSFVRGKITSLGPTQTLSADDEAWIERLGGRASDLDTLIHKVRNGASIQDAVQNIIARGVGELKKTAFGDDVDDAKGLPWKPEQVWSVLKQLAKTNEISYAEVLLEFPFKGDESALWGMEQAELISITTLDGLPVSIKPGKPVYRYVFQRLVNDNIFHAVQDIAYGNKAIAAEEATIRKCEDELMILKSIGLDTGSSLFGGSGATASRANYLLRKMKASEEKLEAREKEIKKLKKVLSFSADTKA